MDQSVVEYINRYKATGLTGVPCTEIEVASLESDLGVRLPSAYRAMLLLMGREPDPAFVGTDMSIRHLRNLREWAQSLLNENGRPFELPPTAFVFLSHQGYQFTYFLVDGKVEDPAVHHYLEGNAGPQLVADRFSNWLCSP